MLRFDGVTLAQGDFLLTADFTVTAGAVTALIGPSGAGKSTLLNAVAGFLPVMTGQISWQDQNLGMLAPGKRPVSILFQDNNLFPHLTAFQNVALGLGPMLRPPEADRTRILQSLSDVGLADMADRKPAELSGGQQGRVALARLLLREMPLALLDEPFAALGPALKTEMLDLTARLAKERGMTVLMVSHDPGDAQRIAEETIVVSGGAAASPKPTRALFEAPTKALKSYLG